MKVYESKILGPDSIHVRSQDYRKTFTVTDGPIRPGGKYTNTEPSYESADGLEQYSRAGGCGYNASKSLRKVPRSVDVTVRLIDESTPQKLILDRISGWDIEPVFLNGRGLGHNLVISYDGDKIIIRGPIDLPKSLKDSDYELIRKKLYGADGLLINNVKHPQMASVLIDAAKEMRIPIYFGATTSPSIDFVATNFLPRVPSTISYEDLAKFYGLSTEDIANIRPNELIDATSQFLKELVLRDLFGDFPTVVTLGSQGMITRTASGVTRHTVLDPPHTERVRTHLLGDVRGSLGGGDYFTGAWFDQLTARSLTGELDTRTIQPDELEKIVKRANIHALEVMRYNGRKPSLSSFTTRPL